MAQSVRELALNHKVAGSSPTLLTDVFWSPMLLTAQCGWIGIIGLLDRDGQWFLFKVGGPKRKRRTAEDTLDLLTFTSALLKLKTLATAFSPTCWRLDFKGKEREWIAQCGTGLALAALHLSALHLTSPADAFSSSVCARTGFTPQGSFSTSLSLSFRLHLWWKLDFLPRSETRLTLFPLESTWATKLKPRICSRVQSRRAPSDGWSWRRLVRAELPGEWSWLRRSWVAAAASRVSGPVRVKGFLESFFKKVYHLSKRLYSCLRLLTWAADFNYLYAIELILLHMKTYLSVLKMCHTKKMYYYCDCNDTVWRRIAFLTYFSCCGSRQKWKLLVLFSLASLVKVLSLIILICYSASWFGGYIALATSELVLAIIFFIIFMFGLDQQFLLINWLWTVSLCCAVLLSQHALPPGIELH